VGAVNEVRIALHALHALPAQLRPQLSTFLDQELIPYCYSSCCCSSCWDNALLKSIK